MNEHELIRIIYVTSSLLAIDQTSVAQALKHGIVEQKFPFGCA